MAYARTLARSVASVHPDWEPWVLLVDRVDRAFDPAVEPFRLVEVEALPIPQVRRFLFRYDVVEASTAAKPWFFRWLFDRGYERVVFLDPDVFVYAPLDEVQARWERGALAILTPHLTGRLTDGRHPSERDILVSGTYNLGFVALGRHQQLPSLLDFWCDKSLKDFVVDIQGGLFTDQKWMDLLPGLFDGVEILRHDGYNVAYWNLPHRTIEGSGGVSRVNGRPLVFFHFSGLDPLDPESFSKYQDRFRRSDLGAAGPLVDEYCRTLLANGHAACQTWPYAYGTTADGVPIPREIRRAYDRYPALWKLQADDPFALGHEVFTRSAFRGTPPVSWVMQALHDARPDVRAVFPDIRFADRAAFVSWFAGLGAAEHRIPPAYLDGLRGSVGSRLARAARRTAARLTFGNLGWLALPAARTLRAVLRNADSAPPRKGTASLADYDGFYSQSADERARGLVWMAREATLRLPPVGPTAELLVSGLYDPGPYQRSFGSGASRLAIAVDGVLVAETVLAQGGPFEIRAPLPTSARSGAVLSLRSDRAFVPAELGLADDIRELSLQIGRIELDGQQLFDSSRAGSPYARSNDAPPVGVNVIGYLHAPTGVGQSARLCAAVCHEAEIPVTMIDVIGGRKAGRAALHPVNVFHVNADETPSVCRYLGEDLRRGRYNIGVWAWELEELPDDWLSSFGYLDEIWAPSRFIQTAIAQKSPLPVVHMPPAVGFEAPRDVQRHDLGLPEDAFLFLVMYDMRSFHARKNPEAVVEAFRRAFPQPAGVRLVIKVNHGHASPSELEALEARLADLPGSILIDRSFSRDQVAALQNLCDAYVSLHRAEGWGFNLIESMSLGKVVIGTHWSGNVDFMDAGNSCPVNYRLVPLTEDVGPYRKGQRWADPDVDHAAWYMRRCLEDPAWRRSIEEAARSTVAERFSYEAAARRYRQRLSLVSRRLQLG